MKKIIHQADPKKLKTLIDLNAILLGFESHYLFLDNFPK